jgi:hypothetical protein
MIIERGVGATDPDAAPEQQRGEPGGAARHDVEITA